MIDKICMYLPHDVNILLNDGKVQKLSSIYPPKDSKLILRPLSDIKKFPEIMEEFSDASWDYFETTFFLEIGRCINWKENITFEIAELIFKNKLDLYGLIETGDAISVYDIPQDPYN